ncbi:lethal(3)malignant brain tumor-like protein 3 isoform X2 [Nilaparvata lugens]|uniref:lethal(3)malignant brain tumor-like protein 3 isoform X2 n=1 Tax=Nilaparvata lugens TaxID=108931 RepID=UPI00193D590E|nr:lethal(3)malignant brain tumor-like protein 3 isoform X2 [Nilaparvata lugens]
MENANSSQPAMTGTGAVPNVTITPNATNPTVVGTSDATTPRLIQLKVAPAPPTVMTSPSPAPPRPPTPHSSIVVPSPTPAATGQSIPSIAQASPITNIPRAAQSTPSIVQAPPTSNIPRICNLGPLIYLQATGVPKGGTPVVNSAVAQGGNTTTNAPVQFTMPQVFSEAGKSSRKMIVSSAKNWVQQNRIITGNPQIIHTNNSQSNQAFAYLGTLIKQGVKGKEATSQKVLLTPMPNKSPQIAILPQTENQPHGNKAPMASLILQQGANVQGKMTGLILGSPNSNPGGNKTTSLLLPAPPGGAQGKKIANINIPGKANVNVPNIIRQNASGGKAYILPQTGNSPGLIIPGNQVGKPGGNQVTGLILPSTSSSGLIIPPNSTTGSTNLTILTTQPSSANQMGASLIISNPNSGGGLPPVSVVTSGVTTSVAASGGAAANQAAGTKMAGIFLPVSMEVQGKNNLTHHLTISNGKISETSTSITMPALKSLGSYGVPALHPIGPKDSGGGGNGGPSKACRSVLKKNNDFPSSSDKLKKDESKEDDLLCHEQPDVLDISDDNDKPPEVNAEIKPEVIADRKPSLDGEMEPVSKVVDHDLNKENTLPNVKEEDEGKTELRITPPPEDFDPLKVLEWDAKGVGKLPGSDLKFKMNDLGMMVLHDENDTKPETETTPPAPTVEKKEEKKPHKEPVKASSKTIEEIYCCDSCGCYGLSTEFLDPQFCSVACRKFMQIKSTSAGGGGGGSGGGSGGGAATKGGKHKTAEELRDLKLRKKRRKMKILELRREAAALQGAEGVEGGDKKEIDWLKEFVVLRAKKEAAAHGPKRGSSSQNGAGVKQEEGDEEELPKDGEEKGERRTSLDDVASDQGSRSGSVSPTLSDNCDNLSLSDKKAHWLSKTGEFLWTVYLNWHKAKPAHTKLFKDPFPYQKNGFKVGMKLEGIDPLHQSYICVLTVAEVRGFRIRLHFDGYPENYDFWTNADSADIFPPGWCEKNGHRLQHPRGYTNNSFNWTVYLKQCKAQAAPKTLFASRHTNPVTPNQFRVGMKVEAVDRQHDGSSATEDTGQLVCVATVADIIDGSRLLIHFDSWNEIYDYWVDPSSPYIHPVGWCQENGHELSPPHTYKSSQPFSWDTYLKETKSVAAPARAFKTRPPTSFRVGMRLEAVDRRAPHLLRVASVGAVRAHQIRLTFDGFPDEFGYWVDDDSPDIHPVGWASKTGHPLEPPPSATSDETISCPTVGCRGDGHSKAGTMLTRHEFVAHCPYTPANLNRPTLLADRFNISKNDIFEVPEITSKPKSSRESRESSVTTDGNKGSYDGDSGDENNGRRSVTSNEDDSRSRTRHSNHSNESKKGKKRKLEKAEDDPSTAGGQLKKLRQELIESVLRPGYQVGGVGGMVVGEEQSAYWSRHSSLVKVTAEVRDNPAQWTAKQVAAFLSTVHPGKSKVFVDQEIDGEALLMLSQSDLTSLLGFKLGPAIKIYNVITILRQKVF